MRVSVIVAAVLIGATAYFWPKEEEIVLRDLRWSEEGDLARFSFTLDSRLDHATDVNIAVIAERRSEGRDGSTVAVVGHVTMSVLLAPKGSIQKRGEIRLASAPRGVLSLSTRITQSSNKSAQHNAGSRPSSGDSPASETPSMPAPRG